jgi:TolA-binding protein
MRAPALVFGMWALSGCGVFALQKDHDAVAVQAKQSKDDVASLRADLQATRERLDNALRANADSGADLMSEKARINQMVGRIDELAHSIDELKTSVTAMRTELDARIDELKRQQTATLVAQQTPPSPPVPIPPDKAQHFAAVENAYKAKDWGLTRTFGHEYMNRYPTDDKADDVLYLMGDADLQDARASSALGEFTNLLKTFPKSNMLDKTLFGIGEAYMQMHACSDAKLAYEACAAHFPKEKIGADAKKRIADIDKAPPGSCAPP